MTDNRTVRLSAVNALVSTNKTLATRALTDSHRSWAADPLAGVHRQYQPEDDEGERLPSQSKRVELHVSKSIDRLSEIVGRVLSLEFAQDAGNAVAKADVVVDGTVLLADVPVTFLLRLDKWLVDLRTYIDNLPTLDAATDWQWDDARECWISVPVTTVRTVKVPKVFVKWAPPSEKYSQPAQTEVVHEDVRAGTWTTVQLSGAVPADMKRSYQAKVAKLVDAVRVAREAANATEVSIPSETGKLVFDYLFH